MNNKLLSTVLLTLFLITVVSAQNIVNYYGSETCPHCINVKESGILEQVADMQSVELTQYIVETKEGADAYFELHAKNPEIPGGYPIVTIQCGDQFSYIMGDTPIIENLQEAAIACRDGEYSTKSNNTILFIIIAIIVIGIIYFVSKKK